MEEETMEMHIFELFVSLFLFMTSAYYTFPVCALLCDDSTLKAVWTHTYGDLCAQHSTGGEQQFWITKDIQLHAGLNLYW